MSVLCTSSSTCALQQCTATRVHCMLPHKLSLHALLQLGSPVAQSANTVHLTCLATQVGRIDGDSHRALFGKAAGEWKGMNAEAKRPFELLSAQGKAAAAAAAGAAPGAARVTQARTKAGAALRAAAKQAAAATAAKEGSSSSNSSKRGGR
eukprot:6757-Heterococcus_DN1.PRE.2